MRNLTDKEKAELRHRCPFCRGSTFYLGPQGGLAFNVYCATCYAGFNLTHEKLPWQLISPGGTLKEVAPLLRGAALPISLLTHRLNEAIERSMHEAMDKVRRGA